MEDTSFYFGGGVGIHAVHVEGSVATRTDGYPDYSISSSQSATSPTLDFGCGVSALRTYDTQLHLDVRYHVVLEDFEQAGGNGAHGLTVSIGTGH